MPESQSFSSSVSGYSAARSSGRGGDAGSSSPQRRWLRLPESLHDNPEMLMRLQADLASAAEDLDPHRFSIPIFTSRSLASSRGREDSGAGALGSVGPGTGEAGSDQAGLKVRPRAGRNLEELLQSGCDLTTSHALEIAAQLAERLGEMHDENLTHEGVVTQYVLLGSDGKVKLLFAGARELFRWNSLPGFEPAPFEPAPFERAPLNRESWDEHPLRSADLRGCLRILLYTLASIECCTRPFPEFIERLKNDSDGRWLARRLRHIEQPVRDAVIELLDDLSKNRLEPEYIARQLRGLQQNTPVDLTPLAAPSPLTSEERSQDSLVTVRRQAAFAAAVIFFTVALTYLIGLVSSHRTVAIPARADPDKTSLLTLPGTNGTWWAQDPETFWLLPAVRQVMVEHDFSLAKAAIEGPDRSKETLDIYQAIQDWQPGLVVPPGGIPGHSHDNPRSKVDPLIESMRTDPKVMALTPVMEALAPRDGITPARFHTALNSLVGSNAESLHTRAVLLHRLALLGDTTALSGEKDAEVDPFARAEAAYEKALREYRRASWHKLELLALCSSDYAHLLMAQRKLVEAARYFAHAHQLMDRRGALEPSNEFEDRVSLENVKSLAANAEHLPVVSKADASPALPLPFLVECYCKESQCYRRLGQSATAMNRIHQALQLSLRPTVPFASRAYALERSAWLHMDVWDLDWAEHCFKAARQTRVHDLHYPNSECKSSRCETFLRIQHDEHGLAMVKRYRGDIKNTDDARAMYETILEKLKGSETGPLRTDEREDLETRLLNSLQRYIDSYVYSPTLLEETHEQCDAKCELRNALSTVRRLAVMKKQKADHEARLFAQAALLELAAGHRKAAQLKYKQAVQVQKRSEIRSPFVLDVIKIYFDSETKSATKEKKESIWPGLRRLVLSEEKDPKEQADPRSSVREVIVKLESHIAPIRESIGHDELDVLLLMGRVLAADLKQQAADLEQPDEALHEDRQMLAFLLHGLLTTPRQRQVNAGILDKSASTSSLPKDYFLCHYRQLIELLSDKSVEANANILARMMKVDRLLEEIALQLKQETEQTAIEDKD